VHDTRAAWRLLSRDRELLAIPVLAAAAFASVAGPGLLLLGRSDAARTGEAWFWLLLMAASMVSVCVVALTSAFVAARARAGRVLRWFAVSAALSFLRHRSEVRLGGVGRSVMRIGCATVRAASFVALSAIATRGRGASAGVGHGRVGLVVLLAAGALTAGVVATRGLAVEAVVAVLVGTWTAVVVTITSAFVRPNP
jgi:hypothetical protein